MVKKLVSNGLAIIGLVLLASAPTFADTITIDLSTRIDGATLNAVPTAVFSDLAGSVQLTLTATSDIGNGQHYSALEWLFNFANDADLPSLVFTYKSGDQATISRNPNGYQADGKDAYLDIKFLWDVGDLTQGETAVYEISLPNGSISAADFNLASSGTNSDQYYSALYWAGARGNGVGPQGWVGALDPNGDPAAVPEPGTLLLIGGGLLLTAAAVRRKRT